MAQDLGWFSGRQTSWGAIILEPVKLGGKCSSLSVGQYVLPVGGDASDWYIAQFHYPFNIPNKDPRKRIKAHSGLDINLHKSPWGDVELGDPIYSTCAGMVVYANWALGAYWGNLVITISISLDDKRPVYWRYAHCATVDVVPGQMVSPGQKLGTVGKGAGNRYDAHLHLDCWRGPIMAPDVWWPSVFVDPLEVWESAGYVWDWGVRKRG